MKKAGLLFSILLIMIHKGSAAVNLLANSSFEMDSSAGLAEYNLRLTALPSWTYDDYGRGATAASGANGFISVPEYSTPFGGRFVMMGNGSINPGGTIYQNVSTLSGWYRSSIWAKGYGNSERPISFGLKASWTEIQAGNPTAVTVVQEFTPLNFGNNWTEYSIEYYFNGISSLTFAVYDATPGTGGDQADLFIDNASLKLVPEPSALSLLAVGLGLVLRQRRRTV